MVDLIGNRTLPMLLAEQAQRRGDAEALVFEDGAGAVRSYTYAELDEAAARAAAGLAQLGVGAGDKVVLHLSNRPEVVLTIFALARLGAVAVPSNTANRAQELLHLIGFSDAKLLVTSPDHLELFDAVLPQTPGIERVVLADGDGAPGAHVAFAELLQAPPLTDVRVTDPETPLEILFTSGTTALPKGVVLTHANWLWSGERTSRGLRLDETDRMLTALPLFHVNAQSLTVMNALTLGATAVVVEQFSASRFMDQVRRHGATHTSIVAMLLRTLLAQPPTDADRDHALRRVSYAINVSDAEKDEFERRFGVELLNGYGLSEAMTEVSVCPVGGPGRWPSIGLPAMDRQIRVVDASGHEVAQGEIGEITVKGVPGRTIMKEYYKDPDATARTISDGWLSTGDNGYLDELGYLYFFDRGKDIIKRAGENISASEVEAALAEHPLIARAAVIGVPDAMRDEAVMAFVVLEPGASLAQEDVERHCAQRLARFKVPTIVEFTDALPTTSIGKIEKHKLRALAAAGVVAS
jgi:crotonobetaine/carnitine-CoA ligase